MAALPKITAPKGMGDAASSASGGGEVDVDVAQGRSGAGHRFDPPSGTSLLVVPSMVPRKGIAYHWQGEPSSASPACRASAI